MSYETAIHPIQTLILRELLFRPSASYSELQKISGLDSDHFKFHIQRLVASGYVTKSDKAYLLSVSGKEYANKLDTDENVLERQPKSAVILVIRSGTDSDFQYVFQERLKHPYYGFWGFPSGKIRWGESIYTTASRELMEETGLTGTFEHKGIYHERVIHEKKNEIVEDKIFHIMLCTNPDGTLLKSFEGGKNEWLPLDTVRNYEKRYQSFDIEADMALSPQMEFIETVHTYADDQF